MRIGIFGGSFDPPHLGHLIMAERCRESAKLDEVWFLPSFQPPHKLDRTMTRYESRCEMTSLAVIGQPAFLVNRIESELPPPSYTAETLKHLRDRDAESTFHLIIGSDSLVDFPGWYHPENIVSRASLIVVARPGLATVSVDELAKRIHVPANDISLHVVDSPLIDISSTDIRKRVSTGQSIRYLVPRSVEEFIREKRLYS